jgi:hypothetical protein
VWRVRYAGHQKHRVYAGIASTANNNTVRLAEMANLSDEFPTAPANSMSLRLAVAKNWRFSARNALRRWVSLANRIADRFQCRTRQGWFVAKCDIT